MEILKTFIVEKGSMGNDKRFVKVYFTVGKKYFLQVPQGAMYEISETEFQELSDNTWKSLQ